VLPEITDEKKFFDRIDIADCFCPCTNRRAEAGDNSKRVSPGIGE
jgi:hypothetical protein